MFYIKRTEGLTVIQSNLMHFNYVAQIIMYVLWIHWGQKHICVSKLTNIGPDNGLLPGRRQAIIWTNAGILLNGPLGTNFSEIIIEIHTFSFKKIHLIMSSAKCQPFCPSLNVLRTCWITYHQWHFMAPCGRHHNHVSPSVLSSWHFFFAPAPRQHCRSSLPLT